MSEARHCEYCFGTKKVYQGPDKQPIVEQQCPGVTCPHCAEKQAEIARLTATVQAQTKVIAAAKEMADALEDYRKLIDASRGGFSQREPGVMQDFLGGIQSAANAQLALGVAITVAAKFRAAVEEGSK